MNKMPTVKLLLLIVVILMLAVGTTIAVAQEVKTYTNQEYNFSFEYPEGWGGMSTGNFTGQDVTGVEVEGFQISVSKNVEIRPTVYTVVSMGVEVDKFPAKRTLDEYASSYEKQLKENPGTLSYNKVQEYNTVFKGKNATVRVFTWFPKYNPSIIKGKAVFFMESDVGYRLELLAPSDYYNDSEPIFEKMLQSFSFLPSRVLNTTTPTPTPTPILTFTSTPTPTPKLTEITTTPKIAGFEVVLAIVGMLAIAHIMRKYNRRKQK
jgi:hypothetical protein